MANNEYDIILKDIKKENADIGWYIDSQSEWANLPFIKPIYEKRKKLLLDMIKFLKRREEKRSLKILDCGCGDGYYTNILSTIDNLNIIAIDSNPIRVKRAQKKCQNVSFYCMAISELTEKINKKFDLIWFSQVIEHIEDDEGVLKLLNNLLDDDGILIIGTPNEGSILYSLKQKITNYRNNSDHVHFYTLNEITQKLKKCGYKITKRLFEPAYIYPDNLFYKLMTKKITRYLLEIISKLFPRLCSDYYFVCKKIVNKTAKNLINV